MGPLQDQRPFRSAWPRTTGSMGFGPPFRDLGSSPPIQVPRQQEQAEPQQAKVLHMQQWTRSVAGVRSPRVIVSMATSPLTRSEHAQRATASRATLPIGTISRISGMEIAQGSQGVLFTANHARGAWRLQA